VPDLRLGSLDSFAAQDLTRFKFNSKCGRKFPHLELENELEVKLFSVILLS